VTDSLFSAADFEPPAQFVSWVVPGLNLIAPPFVMWDLLRTSNPDSLGSEGRRWDPWVLLVVLWWAGWITALAILYVGFRPVLEGHPTPSELITRDRFAIAASLIGIPVAAIAAFLLYQVNARQVLKEDRLVYSDWVGWSKSA